MELSYAHKKILAAIEKINGKPTTIFGIGEIAGLRDWTAKKSIQDLKDAGLISLEQTRRNAPGIWRIINK